MKKKLIQILMLLVAAVSVGSFVSCKDTNEDLYNELRAETINGNATLEQALNQRINDLQKEIDALKTLKSCTCAADGWHAQITQNQNDIADLQGDLSDLQGDVKDNTDAIADLTKALNDGLAGITALLNDYAKKSDLNGLATEAELNALRLTLEGMIGNIRTELDILKGYDLLTKVLTLQGGQQALDARITALENLLNTLNGTDPLGKLSAIEQALKDAEAWKAQFLKDLQTAKETADNANTLANTANINANAALDLAKDLQAKADAADQNATEALRLAKDAWEIAKNALQAANDANGIAVQALTLAKANEADIKALWDKTDALSNRITEVQNDLQKQIGDAAVDIAANARDIAAAAGKIQDNADAIAKIEDEMKTVNKELTAATVKANEAYDKAVDAAAAADANHDLILKLEGAVENNKSNIEKLEQTAKDLESAVDNLKGAVATNTADIKNLQDLVKDLKTDVKELGDKYDDLKDQLSDMKVELAAVKTQCENNLAQAKAYVDAEIATVKLAISTEIAKALEDYYDKDAIDAKLANCASSTDLANKVIELYKAINDGDQEIGDELYKLAQRVAANETSIWYINEALKYLSGKFSEYVPRPELEAWFDRIKALEGKVDGMKDDLKSELTNIINNGLKDIKDQLPAEIKNILNGTDFDFLNKSDVEKIVNDILNDRLTKEGFLDGIADIADLRARVNALEKGGSYVLYSKYVTDTEKIWNSIRANHNKIEDLRNAVKTINSKLPQMESDIADLKTRMGNAESKLATLVPDVEALKTNVAAIQSYLGQQITGIEIQGTNNPMFGYFSLPLDLQSNVLVAYYGVSTKPVKFPATSSVRYIRKDEALTPGDWAMIGSVKGQINESAPVLLMNENEDGMAVAGKVYVTVNPSSIDATKLEPMKIVNTQDTESLIKLSKLRRSTDLLQFGPTRAINGFYEADAYVDVTDATIDDETLQFEESDMQRIIDDARAQLGDMVTTFFQSTGATGKLDKVATDIYQVFRNLKLDQKGLKCPFKAPDNTETAVYSKYNMAATVIKPLSLGSLKVLETYETLPGYEAARDALMNDIATALKGYIHVYFKAFDESWRVGKLGTLSFDGVKLLGDANALVNKFETRLSGFTWEGTGYTFDIPANGNAVVMFDENLKNNGNAVTIPDAVKFKANPVNAKKVTLLIGGDITKGMTASLLVPAVGADGVVAAWASVQLVNVVVNLTAGNEIEVKYDSGTMLGNVAKVTGNAISTTGYAKEFVLDNLTGGTKGTVGIPVVADVSSDLQKLLNGQSDVLKTLSDLTKDLDEFLKKIKNYEAVMGSQIDEFLVNYLKVYLDKINNTTTYFFKSINRRFGPFMVASNDSKGFKVMSTTKVNPTLMKASGLKLYATTKNLELLVPIARKHIAVTNVYNEDLTKNAQDNPEVEYLKLALQKVNAGDKFNEVLDGQERVIKADGLFVPSLIYEVAYSVLDFDGNVSTTKCYITVTNK